MKLENPSRNDLILGAVALLLAIDLIALPWFDIGIGPISITSTATGAPDGWLGVLGLLAALGVVADLGVERLSPQTKVPALSGSRTMTRLVLSGLAALFVTLKFLFHIHFSLFGFGFWAAIVLAAALVAFAVKAHGSPVMSRPAASKPSGIVPPTP